MSLKLLAASMITKKTQILNITSDFKWKHRSWLFNFLLKWIQDRCFPLLTRC